MDNCYFYTTGHGEERHVVPLCVACHDEKFPDLGWFYPGKEKGFGPFEFRCEKCGEMIFSPDYEKDSRTN